MKLLLKNTTTGLIPLYDADYDQKRKLKIGEVYQVEIKKARNYELHKKYFSLIHCAWEYQNEKRQAHFKNSVENFRKSVEIAAGHCDVVYSIRLKEWVEVPKSVSFSKMGELEFRTLYENVRTVLFSVFLTHISEKDFNEQLINY
mgnify:CR=1 FL=1